MLPAGLGAILSARVDYETHYANVGDRNVSGTMRWWATYCRYGDEIYGNSTPKQPYCRADCLANAVRAAFSKPREGFFTG